jgi:hypothetical protein
MGQSDAIGDFHGEPKVVGNNLAIGPDDLRSRKRHSIYPEKRPKPLIDLHGAETPGVFLKVINILGRGID